MPEPQIKHTHIPSYLDDYVQKWSLCLPGRLWKAAAGFSPWLAIRDTMVILHKGCANIRLVSIPEPQIKHTQKTNVFLDYFIQKWSLCLPGRLLKAAAGPSPWLAIRDIMVSLHKGCANIRLVSIIICWSRALMLAVLLDISSKVLKAVTLAPKGTSRMHGCRTFSTQIFSTQFFILYIIVKVLTKLEGPNV